MCRVFIILIKFWVILNNFTVVSLKPNYKYNHAYENRETLQCIWHLSLLRLISGFLKGLTKIFILHCSWFSQVLTISVLSIIVTAPIGAALIGMTGPKLLSKSGEFLCRMLSMKMGYLNS